MVAVNRFILVILVVAVSDSVSFVLNKGCLHNGTLYRVGQTYFPRPCDICTCSASGARCSTNNCFYYVRCADGHVEPDKCCRTCPNGDNCKAPDGTIIKRGDTYHPIPHITCVCKEDNFGLYGGMAVCSG